MAFSIAKSLANHDMKSIDAFTAVSANHHDILATACVHFHNQTITQTQIINLNIDHKFHAHVSL
jgi:hypothetical protein